MTVDDVDVYVRFVIYSMRVNKHEGREGERDGSCELRGKEVEYEADDVDV